MELAEQSHRWVSVDQIERLAQWPEEECADGSAMAHANEEIMEREG
jgi:hypothetical protein